MNLNEVWSEINMKNNVYIYDSGPDGFRLYTAFYSMEVSRTTGYPNLYNVQYIQKINPQKIMEWTVVEEFFVEVYRNFSFLRMYGYEGKEFIVKGREAWVSFQNPKIRQEIIVIMEEPFVLNIYFERRRHAWIFQSIY